MQRPLIAFVQAEAVNISQKLLDKIRKTLKKLAFIGLFKISICWDYLYDAIRYVYDVINWDLLRKSTYIVNIIIWVKFGKNCALFTNYITNMSNTRTDKTKSICIAMSMYNSDE